MMRVECRCDGDCIQPHTDTRVEETTGSHDAAVPGIRFNPSTTKTSASAFVGVDAMHTIEIRTGNSTESPSADSGSSVNWRKEVRRRTICLLIFRSKM